MNMKKKLVAGGLVAALAATAIGGATLAYFTDTDNNVSNTFTVGAGIEITLDEAPVNKTGDEWVADNEADRVAENTYVGVYPGAELPKDPTITNEGGPAYVRMVVTIDNATAWQDACKKHNITDLGTIFTDYDEADWSKASVTLPTEGNDTLVYVYEYTGETNGILATGDTATLFKSVIIPASFDNEDMENLGENFHINIQGQAIQADGFANADAAFAALDTELAG